MKPLDSAETAPGFNATMSAEAKLNHSERHWFLMPLFVLVLGAVSIAMLIGTDWIRVRLVRQDTALHRAVGDIETRLSTAHLWLEEYVSGDHVDMEEIDLNLARAENAIETVLNGGALPGVQRMEPLKDEGLRRQAESIGAQIRRFHDIAESRKIGFQRGEDVGIGSAIDGVYDEAFRDLLTDLRDLDAVVEDRLNRAHSRSALLFRTVLTAWVVIVGLAVSGLSRLEIRRRRAERALRDSETQLRQSQKMEAVGRLAGGMAHDINNYLAAISAQCELVIMTSDSDSPLRGRMESVVSITTKATALIERLLSFSRQRPVQPEIVNLNRAVADSSILLEQLIGEDVDFETRLEDGLWNIEIDPSEIEQIILNLVVNAREAMPTGGDLSIETSNRSFESGDIGALPINRAGDYVVLSVADSGVGISEEVRERIFEPFVTTKSDSNQSGLGLATTFAIAKQNGGGVAVSSEEGHGATFTVYLPRTRALTQIDVGREGTEPRRGDSQHILLVEDNLELRDVVDSALVGLGYRVTAVASAEEALEVVESIDQPADLLLTDVVMPGMNGRELSEVLHARYPQLEVLFISGYADDVILRHGVEIGKFRFLQKPFSIHDLAATIGELLAEDARPSEIESVYGT